ncbi:MAG: threonine--tRNA ligase [Candidatus Falkowbacteria bacterium]|nr:threonine--tRNA ligase [Candidatus Falkowbacteria bacterium]
MTKRHSLAHLLAYAIKELYPNAKLAIGPAIETGFYYDIDFGEQKISETDLKEIEKKMAHYVKQNLKFSRREEKIDLAIKNSVVNNDTYKIELLKDLRTQGETMVSFYTVGTFTDLCRGPHLESTKDIKPGSFNLQRLAGAYWRGDEKNKMLTRIYGLAYDTKEDLDNYLKLLIEAEKRDHRKLGKELGLFIFSDLVGPGLPLYTNKGAIIRKLIVDYCNELQSSIGYQEVHTPNINKAELFKISGHYEKYKDDMLRVVSNYTDEEYFLKPMNCPQHTQIYAAQARSYRDLPLRIADFANLYRDERPGELSGLTRLRCFCQDDGHCFCREDQIKEEFVAVLKIVREAMQTYKMKYKIRLSLWDPKKPEKYLGEALVWEKAQKILEEILIENKVEFFRAEGEAAIYGPKMDLISSDSLGREWQISTIQLDFIMPQRFGLEYTAADGKKRTPIMIHRAIIGSPERFLGILIEHYAGAFPVWLSPVQVKIISVGETHLDYCHKLAQELKDNKIRVEIDDNNETVGNKIRKASQEKVPYMLVIGDKEINSPRLNVRDRGQQDTREIAKLDFIKEVLQRVETKE